LGRLLFPPGHSRLLYDFFCALIKTLQFPPRWILLSLKVASSAALRARVGAGKISTESGRPRSASLTLTIIIAIAVTGVVLMRFQKRWLAKFNILVTNRITGLFAPWLPGFGVLTHIGRKSHKIYRTPVNVFRVTGGFIIALTYSSRCEWVKNVLAAGGCELKTVGRKYQLLAPKVVHDETRKMFPIPVRIVLRLVGADEYIQLSRSSSPGRP
jgi:deazaflavin-dependent oxidoreductase (nitroreductase family)